MDGEKSPLTEKSVIVHAIASLFAAIAVKVRSSAIFTFFTSLRAHNGKTDSYAVKKLSAPVGAAEKSAARMKRFLSQKFSQSAAARLAKKVRYAMLRTSIRSYGLGFFIFGLYAAAVSGIKQYASGELFYADASLVTGVMCTAAGLIAMIPSRPVIELLCESRSLSSFINSVLCIRTKDALDDGRFIKATALPLLFGTLAGLATFFVPPLTVLLFLLGALAVSLAFISPEFGVNVLIFLLPFLDERKMTFIIAVTFVSYLFKYVRGKRIYKFGITELFPLVIGALGIIRSLVASDGSEVSVRIVFCIPLLYISVRNMFRSRDYALSLADMLGYSFFIIFGLRMIYCLLGRFGVDTSAFSFISGIGDPYAVGEYTVLCTGFALYCTKRVGLFGRRVALGAMIGLAATVPLAMGDGTLAITAAVAAFIYAAASRQKFTIFALPLTALIPVSYALFKDAEPVRDFLSVFCAGNASGASLSGRDLLYVYGIGGACLFALFFILSLSERASVASAIDGERRSLYAAAASSVAALITYSLLGGFKLQTSSLLFLVTVAALSSAFNRNNSITMDRQGETYVG